MATWVVSLLALAGAAGAETEMAPGTIVAQEQAKVDPVEATLEGDLFTFKGSFFTTGADLLCQVESVPADKVPADAPERWMRSGSGAVALAFPGVAVSAGYDLELSFLSDSDDRVEQISAGRTVLEQRLVLPRAQVLRRRWQVPDSACGDGTLVVTIRKVAGPNAVVSAVTLRAHNSGAKILPAPQIRMRVPRISPRPAAVAGVVEPLLDLGGVWRFRVDPGADFNRAASEPTGSGWSDIQVPGQWLQQGFSVEKNMTGIYRRSFAVPGAWAGKRIKLRCDAVYSDAAVWINGKNVGRHLGGFTPFEIDVTDAVTGGREATITLAVRSEGEADELASGMRYASHDLGGITRKIELMAVPTVNLASVHVGTVLDRECENATLEVAARVANDGGAASPATALKLLLHGPEGEPVPIDPAGIEIPALEPGETVAKTISIPVARPQVWDTEHPRLYTLTSAVGDGQTLETVSTRVGFRKVEVRANRVFVNGSPVRLRGVCRHEIDPLRGRSLNGDSWRTEAETFARANVNFIRTSHYPPAEEFLDACDAVGIFVESEAPVCWAADGRESLPLLLGETMDMVEFNRNHPSVIIWSLANESQWGPHFGASARMVARMDPSRPRIFSYDMGLPTINSGTDLVSWHYPTPARIADVDHLPKPVLCDEYCHLNAYNRREQIADPGLRDMWGQDLSGTWEAMRSHSGCLGGAIWAGIDDTFFLPGGRTVGYGTWGVIDDWRRPKPEYWHVTKVYSPARILDEHVEAPAAGQPIRLTVENRSDFANLNEMRFDWKLAGESGIAAAHGAPGQKAVLEIPAKGGDLAGRDLEIRISGPRGFLVDAYRFAIGGKPDSAPPPPRHAAPLTLTRDAKTITVGGAGFAYVIDAATGQLTHATASGHDLPVSGPFLTLVPRDQEGGGLQLAGKEPTFAPLWGLGTDWTASSVLATPSEERITVKVRGAYAESDGAYELAVDGSGRVTVAWSFLIKNEANPRQTGVTFILPRSCDTLSWRRRGQWSFYPEDHVGRLAGAAKAFPGHPVCGLAGPHARPTWPWSEDQNEFGSNDFRSTKCNILEATLDNDAGIGLRTVAAADRHVHAWIEGDHAMLMVADYANEGSDRFTQFTRIIPDRPIAKGGTLAGSVQIEVVQRP